jgi:hypothetical protein
MKIMSDTVLCKDCKHSFTPWHAWLQPSKYALHCRKTLVATHTNIDPVIGEVEVKSHYQTCQTNRLRSFKDETCGPDGRNWEPKRRQDLFKYIKHVST